MRLKSTPPSDKIVFCYLNSPLGGFVGTTEPKQSDVQDTLAAPGFYRKLLRGRE